jgi:tetratricopeptide (TPR) repeat protein
MSTTPETLGQALRCYQAGDFRAAEQLCRQLLQAEPANVQAWCVLGAACHRQGRLAEAVAGYREAVRLQPGYAAAHSNLGVALRDQGDVDGAIAAYEQALRLNPGAADAHNNLGNALAQKGQYEAAEMCFRQALRLKPEYAEGYSNLGNVLRDSGRHAEALACFEQALRLNPDHVESHFNRALEFLRTGNFTAGWAEFEWRWRLKEFHPLSFPQPRWDGSPLAGRTVLLYGEQGLGDTLQFVRFAPLVRQRGGRVILACAASLHPLLARTPGIDQLAPVNGPFPDFDVQTPLLSLGGVLQVTLAHLPAEVPYVFPDPDLVERWGGDLAGLPGFKVGIAWQGNPGQRVDRWRSFPLRVFSPLARMPGVRLVSLQKGLGTEQLRQVPSWPVTDLGSRLDEGTGAFLDTAAVMKHLDLVVTCDTAVAHLAGALGVPVWVPLPYAADWRYLLEREDSPWYPTMRLFRQTRLGDWAEVFERIAVELASRSGRTGVPVRPGGDPTTA